MLRLTTKKLAVLVLFVMFVVCLVVTQTAFAAESITLNPSRSTEFGNTVGELITIGNKVYQNYERGYVVADKISDTSVQNKRDVGGKNINASGVETYVDIEDYIKGLSPVGLEVRTVYAHLYEKYGLDVAETVPETYNPDTAAHILGKIYDKYKALTEQGYNCGIPTEGLSIWDGEVIKIDFYDGDCEYGFDDNRTRVSTVAYSFLQDDAYVIEGDIFNFYREAKAGSLAEPISDRFDYKMDGVDGTVQAFAQGYIFCPEKGGTVVVKAGVRWNGKKFEILTMSYEDLTRTEISQAAIDSNQYYGNKGLTVEKVKELFYQKYEDLIDNNFNPGIPDAEGIFYWDGRLLKQAYVGSDGTGNAWGRTNMMLILNPNDQKVYMVSGEILNIVDEAGQGLGTAELLGYPLGDAKTQEVNGFTYTYQDFSQGVIYSIENVPQLTRFIKGKTFADVVSSNADVTPNNPMFYYVLEPWIIAVICVGGVAVITVVVLLATGVLTKGRKSKQKAQTEANATEIEE